MALDSEMTPRVTVLGSFVVGATVRLPRMPLPGETLPADLFDLGPGGKGTNVAIGIQRLGGSVEIVLCVGDDEFSGLARKTLVSEGIAINNVRTVQGKRTGIGLVYLNGSNGENTIGLFPGANMEMTIADIQPAMSSIQKSQICTAQLEIPTVVIESAFGLARHNGVVTLLNPAPARVLTHALLQLTDIITPNVNELYQLLNRSVPESTEDGKVEEAARDLQRTGPSTVVVTMGCRGALAISASGAMVRVPAFAVSPIDTVGAGDAFNAGLAFSLAQEAGLEEAIRFASACGAATTRVVGVLDALPRQTDLQGILNRR